MNGDFPTDSIYQEDTNQVLIRAYLNNVFLWLAACLAVTAGVAYYSTKNEALSIWVMQHTFMLGLVTFAVVVVMSLYARRFTTSALAGMLLLFAGLQGLFFGPFLFCFSGHSLALTFGVTACTFGGMVLYGATTRRDLNAWGRGLFMALIGLILAGLAHCFWGNSLTDLLISGCGVLVFSLFTAYDIQQLVFQGRYLAHENDRAKGAVLGALALYLDFINLFLYLLRFLSRRD